MPVKNYFDHLDDEKIAEGVAEYEKLGVPRRAICVRFDQSEEALEWVLFVDLSRVQPHKRRSLQTLLKDVPIKRGVLITHLTEFERAYGSVIFPTMQRVEPELIAHELVSIQPMSGPVGLTFYTQAPENEERSEDWRSNWEEIPSEEDG